MKTRFEVLDIFRGIFSAMVVLFHLSPFAKTAILNNNFINNSDLFVDFFFVLSGFVIVYTYHSRINTPTEIQRFLKRRFFRIYPLHFILLFIFLAVEVSKHYLAPYIHVNNLEGPNNNLTTFLSSLVLLNSVKLPGVTDVSWNIPSWSISAEMISYLLFALAVYGIGRAGLSRIRSMIYIALIASAVLITAWFTGNWELHYSFDYGFLRGIAGFFTGALCFHLYKTQYERLQNISTTWYHLAELLCVTGIITSVCFGDILKQAGYLYDIIFLLSVLVFTFEKGFISQLLLKSAILKKLGLYSYSIYMVHALFISLFNILFIRILHFQPSAYSYLFIVNFLLIYIAAGWTYRNIEIRFKDLK